MFYYDKFGIECFLEFSCWLEHHLSVLRFRQSSIQFASINKFIKEFNPFAIINDAAFPEHVIRSFQKHSEGLYRNINANNISTGVRNHFYNLLYNNQQLEQGYYCKNEVVLSVFKELSLLKNKISKQFKVVV
jgi:hypothetical protein